MSVASSTPGSPKISTSWPLALDLVVHANLSPVAPLVRGRRGRACQGAAVHVLKGGVQRMEEGFIVSLRCLHIPF